MHIQSTTLKQTRPLARRARAGLTVAGALACAALISACGSSGSSSSSAEPAPGTRPVNTAQVAASIEHTLSEKRHITAKVTCPASVSAEKGKTFVCMAAVHDPTKPSKVTTTPFKVTIQNNRGYVTYVGE
jgi:hypothetical protein